MQQKTAQYKAYSQAFQTVAKTRQVVMLYDGAVRYVQQAKEAIKDNRIEDRYKLLLKASEVVLGLQGCIDFEKGGDVANLLYDFYSSIDGMIVGIHRSNSVDECEEVIQELKKMRDAWQEIDTAASGGSQPQAQAAPALPTPAEAPLQPPSASLAASSMNSANANGGTAFFA